MVFRSSIAEAWRRTRPVVPGLERERDEREESRRALLELAQVDQVLHALGARLDVAVQQRGVARDAEPVRDLVDLEPALRADLLVEQFAPYALAEHLGAAARQGVESRLTQLASAPSRRASW